jgi:crossover junction endodeoxyribonuclease RuvC
MLVLGIDPGIAITGFGLIGLDSAGNPELVTFGVIDTTAVRETSSRLISLYDQLEALLQAYHPDECALEKLFFSKNITTAMAVGEARGVIQLCLARAGLQPGEYAPNEIKQAVTSYGNAGKHQVQEMVRLTLRLDQIPQPDDAADALAIALCHQGRSRIQSLEK